MSYTRYNHGKLKPFVMIIARVIEENPGITDRPDHLMQIIEAEIPDLKDKSRCPNCTASMVEYAYQIDILDVALVTAMAMAVEDKRKKGHSFTASNVVHVPTLDTTDAIRHRTTKCAKLGLVAKWKDSTGRHAKGMWVITRRGFEALEGKEVPDNIVMWRKTKVEDKGHTTTFPDVIHRYLQRRDELPEGMIHPQEWVIKQGLHDGMMF